MMEDHRGKRVYADGALKKFLDARASGASREELSRLSKAALDEQAAMVAIDSAPANDKSLAEFLSENGLSKKPIGHCGRAQSEPCGLTHVHECKIHG